MCVTMCVYVLMEDPAMAFLCLPLPCPLSQFLVGFPVTLPTPTFWGCILGAEAQGCPGCARS